MNIHTIAVTYRIEQKFNSNVDALLNKINNNNNNNNLITKN